MSQTTTSLTTWRQSFSSVAISLLPFPSRTLQARTRQYVVTSPQSASVLQHARDQGLARTSALTFAVGAASVVGAIALAVSLPSPASYDASTSANVRSAPSTSADVRADQFTARLHTTRTQ
jgi:hypothetical protein